MATSTLAHITCTVRVWSGASGAHVRTLVGHNTSVMALAVGLNGRMYSGSWDSTIRVWAAHDGTHLQTLVGHTGSVRALAVSKDGRVVYSASTDCTIRVWSGEDGHTSALSWVTRATSSTRSGTRRQSVLRIVRQHDPSVVSSRWCSPADPGGAHREHIRARREFRRQGVFGINAWRHQGVEWCQRFAPAHAQRGPNAIRLCSCSRTLRCSVRRW
jgi:WD40 repeat protein